MVIDHLRKHKLDFAVDFVYTLALYDPPPAEVPLNSHVGPVIGEFAGWTTDPDLGIAVIVGLGYEQDKALGAVELVQAVEIWSYIPLSPIAEYTAALKAANQTLTDAVSKDHQLPYEVADPVGLYANLESLMYGLSQRRNVILFPFGPKLFALCSILVACSYPQAAVWRVSEGTLGQPTDRLASEFIFGLESFFFSVPLEQPG